MELTMAENDFLDKLLDEITKRLDRVEGKVDKNTALTQEALNAAKAAASEHDNIKKRVGKLEAEKGKKLDLPPNVIYLIALGGVILLIIVASILGVNLGGLVK